MNAPPRMGIPLRPDPGAPPEAVVDTFVRSAIAAAHNAFDKTVRPVDFARQRWGSTESRSVELVTRATSSPAMTGTSGWATELAHVAVRLIASLKPASAG